MTEVPLKDQAELIRHLRAACARLTGELADEKAKGAKQERQIEFIRKHLEGARSMIDKLRTREVAFREGHQQTVSELLDRLGRHGK